MWKFVSHTVTVTPLTKNKQDALLVSSVNDDWVMIIETEGLRQNIEFANKSPINYL